VIAQVALPENAPLRQDLPLREGQPMREVGRRVGRRVNGQGGPRSLRRRNERALDEFSLRFSPLDTHHDIRIGSHGQSLLERAEAPNLDDVLDRLDDDVPVIVEEEEVFQVQIPNRLAVRSNRQHTHYSSEVDSDADESELGWVLLDGYYQGHSSGLESRRSLPREPYGRQRIDPGVQQDLPHEPRRGSSAKA
jgi:hypothetical protein